MALYYYSSHISVNFLLSDFISMASTSSAQTHYEYDLFLSFRGDTRNNFTDHLYKALTEAGIRTFRDDDEIGEGQELKPEIDRSITESRASLIVISEKFATSRWCLDELWLILEQKRKAGHLVFPVFYGVDPSDVRNQRGSFTIEAKEGSKWTEDNVMRWKAALTEVADLKGMVVSGSETAFIANIVHKIYCELDLKLVSTPSDLTGIETRAEGINSWLKNEQPGSTVLSIYGMGGGGKTTLAKYIYYSNRQKFEKASFLEEIENQRSVLLGLQKQLVRDILGKNITISNLSEGTFQIEKAIRRKKVLIVVDDIDDSDVLNTLLGTNVFPTQSKIIITTRLLNIDMWFGSISSGCHVHKVELLNKHESLELLSYHAFGSKIPMEGFEDLALQLAEYCEGNPLALKVLGSSLPVRAQDQWIRNRMIETWTSRMNSLNSLKGDVDHKVQCVLHKSFESLPSETHKDLFLHIASLFLGEYTNQVEKILEKDWYAKSGIATLVNRCLVTTSGNGFRLAMHKLLQDMASKIVRKESKDPAKRSIVGSSDDSCRLLRKGDGSKTIEGLFFDMGEVEQWMTSEAFKTSSLVKMKNLKLLQLEYVKLTGSYENFPDLRWLRWRGCNLKTIPPGLLSSYLVALYMTSGDLEVFDPPTVLHSLKILDLQFSQKLASVCNLYRLPILETLILTRCISLTHVCKTIGDLEHLSHLSLTGCTKWKASSNQTFVNQQPEKLKALFISPEQPLFSLPRSLSSLFLNGNPFEIMPSYIGLEKLRILELTYCPNLKSLLCLPSTLESLYVDWCISLEIITFQSARFTLRVFNYEGCFKLCEIQGLFKLVPIEKLDEAELGHMKWIKAYQNNKVDLVGDLITKGRTWNIQMLYEYGIRSAYLQGIKDQSMATHEFTSSTGYRLSFIVPLHPKKRRAQGLSLTILYRSFGEDRNKVSPLFIKISNKTKGVTWVYNPVVYCKPIVEGEDVVWLSYWPIGTSLDVDDEIDVNLFRIEGMVETFEYGVSLVYMDAGEVEKEEEEKCERTQKEEVIGGDLSGFEVTRGGYYLCRRYFIIPNVPECFFGDNIQLADPPRCNTRVESPITNYDELNDMRNPDRKNYEVEMGVSFTRESETDKIEKAVSGVEGVEYVSINQEARRLIVRGRFDFQEVVTCVRQFEKMVQVFTYYLVPAQESKKDDESDDEFFDFSEPMIDDGRLDDESDDEFFDFSQLLFN